MKLLTTILLIFISNIALSQPHKYFVVHGDTLFLKNSDGSDSIQLNRFGISAATQAALDSKQATLVSATNIKTINGSSILGSGDLAVSGGAIAWDDITGKPTTTSWLSNSTNKNFVTDAQQTVIDNTSGTNTGDNATNTQYSGLAASKENTINAGTNAQYWRGDKSWQTLDKTAVGLPNVDNTSDANKPVSSATQTALNLKANISAPALTGAVTTTGSLGYAATAGGTVTQATNKTTGVTLNKICGQITMNGAALAAAAEVSFVVTNSTVSATDVVIVNVQSVGTAGAYLVSVGSVSNGSFSITVSNASAGSLSQAIVLNFVVIKSVSN